jgi:hypothetical protein
LARVKVGKSESIGVEEKSSEVVYYVRTAVRSGRGTVIGRGEMTCLIDAGDGRHGGEGD